MFCSSAVCCCELNENRIRQAKPLSIQLPMKNKLHQQTKQVNKDKCSVFKNLTMSSVGLKEALLTLLLYSKMGCYQHLVFFPLSMFLSAQFDVKYKCFRHHGQIIFTVAQQFCVFWALQLSYVEIFMCLNDQNNDFQSWYTQRDQLWNIWPSVNPLNKLWILACLVIMLHIYTIQKHKGTFQL